MYLLDTNVVSEMRKAQRAHTGPARVDMRVTAWFDSVPASSLYLSAVTALELEKGCLLMERRDPAQGRTLREWIDGLVLPTFASRVLPVDLPVALRCAALHVPNPIAERDALIAATALVHGMAVVTRNTQDFESTGVRLIDPWQP
jgi:predicted nucleic acid-binding protein